MNEIKKARENYYSAHSDARDAGNAEMDARNALIKAMIDEATIVLVRDAGADREDVARKVISSLISRIDGI